MSTFADLGAQADIVDALTQVGITEPFQVQTMAIPIGLTGTDLIAQARTGTGKTLAFGVPLLQRIVAPHDRDFAELDAPDKPQALVVTPTRELALQVSGDLAVAGKLRRARVLTVYGGVPYEPQLDTLKSGVDVVVGTPGRLLDLADRGALELSHVRILVLDEADRMLDLGFLPDVERLIAKTHELRQTMLFSATIPGDIVTLARRHMRHPINVRAEAADESQVVPATAQFVYRTHSLDKTEMLARILQAEDRGRVMIFCTTKRSADRVVDDLIDRGFAAAAIHGDLGQAVRERALRRFREGTVETLVATDVAARGIDVEAVTHVVNYTCPEDEKTYLHRIGRTGRAGATGIAITFVDWADLARWKMINAMLSLPFEDPPETYSTSDHLFGDLGIPRNVTGRVGEPGPRPPSSRAPARDRDEARRRPSRSRSGADAGGRRPRDGESREPASQGRQRDRQRRRMRGGVPVESGAEGEGPAGSPASGPGSSARSGEGGRPRRRRRSRGGKNGNPDTSSS